MEAQALANQAKTNLAAQLKVGSKSVGGGAAGAFEALFAQLTMDQLALPQAGASGPAAVSGAAQAANPASAGTPSTPPATPIRKLEDSLKSTGQDLRQVELPAEARGKLEEVLVASGYSQEQAQEIIQRASQEDGSINLGAMFALLPQYPPQEGPSFILKAEDKPLLIQVLKDLGVGEDEIAAFMQKQTVTPEGDLKITGLPSLLAQAFSGKENRAAGKVDQGILKDLLGRLGLEDQEIQKLLAKSFDAQGNTNPRAVLAMLQVAAERQDHGVAQALKDLAAQVQVTPVEPEVNPATQSARLKDEVLQKLMALDQAPGDAEVELEEVLSAAERAAGRQNETGTGLGGQQRGNPWAGLTGQTGRAAAASGPAAGATASTNAGGSGGDMAAAVSGPGAAAADKAAATAGLPKTSAPLPGHVVRQVAEQMAQMAKNNANQLRLQLKPAELGELAIRLTVKDGAVRATLVAESVAAKHALDQGLDQLKQQLVQQGLKAERIDVFVNPDAQREWAQAQAQARQGGSGGRGARSGGGGGDGEAGEADPEAQAQSPNPGGLGRINLFA